MSSIYTVIQFLVILIINTPFTQAETYVAAVVEHAPVRSVSPTMTMEKNLDQYKLRIQAAQVLNVNIVVFPEYGLTTILDENDIIDDYAIEIPEEITIESNEILRRLQTITQGYSICVVINLIEKQRTDQKRNTYYNTNIVFNKGKLISKYRKINVQNDERLTPGDSVVTFTTDFNVTFGMLIGNDIFYENPSVKLLQLNQNISDVVFSTSWPSVLPYASSLSVQAAYARANRVNLLASNYNNPSKGHGGSGIFTSFSSKAYYISDQHSTELKVAECDKIRRRPNKQMCSNDAELNTQAIYPRWNASPSTTSLKLMRILDYMAQNKFDSSKYSTKDVNIQNKMSTVVDTICRAQFCCDFNISILEPSLDDYYKLVAFDGANAQANNHRYRFCAFMACPKADISSCGDKTPVFSKFGRISVKSTFTNSSYHWPITLTPDLTPLEDLVFCEYWPQTNQTSVNSTYLSTSSNSHENIFVFGMFGSTESSSVQIGNNVVCLFVVMLAKLIFIR